MSTLPDGTTLPEGVRYTSTTPEGFHLVTDGIGEWAWGGQTADHLHLNDHPENEAMDLDAISEDLYTLARKAERHTGEGEPLGDDFATILADLAAQVAQWHEAVEE